MLKVVRLRIMVMCAAVVVGSASVSAQADIDNTDTMIDSLTALLSDDIAPAQRLAVLEQISLNHYNVDSTEKYARMELALARQLRCGLEAANANRYLGWCCYHRDEYEKSCEYYREAINGYDSLGMRRELATGYYGLASALGVIGDDVMADDYYSRALTIYIDLRDTLSMAEIYRKKGYTSSHFHLYETAAGYFHRAYRLDSLCNDSAAIGEDIYMLGFNEFLKYRDFAEFEALDSARVRMLKAIGIENRHGDWQRRFVIVQDLMDVFMEIAKIQTGDERAAALDISRFYRDMVEEMLNVSSLSEDGVYLDLWQVNFFMINGRFNEALAVLKEVEKITNMLWHKEIRMCELMVDCYKELGDYKNALKYTNLRTMLDKETYKRDFAVKSTQTSANIDFERRMHQRELAAQHQKYMTRIAIISLLLMSALFVVILLGFLRKRKLSRELAVQKDEVLQKNNELNIRNEEILAQRDEIEKQRNSITRTNQAITASIKYAKHVQDAAVTSKEEMNRIFGDSLIYWRPMNIVSGDFYWAIEKGECKMIAVADCTGHGVPGAFMSMFGISTLNSITASIGPTNSAAEVLNQMRAKIIEELHQTSDSGEALESIDMAFCIIDAKQGLMHYAGANRPLLIARNGDIITCRPDRMPVGLHVIHNGPFTDNIIDIKPGDIIYMFTDGITDQFGTDDNQGTEKFTIVRLQNLLKDVSSLTFEQQAAAIGERIAEWRTLPDGTLSEQIDDQLLVGIKV